MKKSIHIFDFTQLVSALTQSAPQVLQIRASIVCPHAIMLPPGFELVGVQTTRVLIFPYSDGIGLAGDNVISHLAVVTRASCKAIYLLHGEIEKGTIRLSHLTVAGGISLVADFGVSGITIEADDVDVVAADARYHERHRNYNVGVLHGAFSLCNRSEDPASIVIACLNNIRIGRRCAPALGSGILITGAGEKAGRVRLDSLTTGPVYAHGMLESGAIDEVSAAIYIGEGVDALEVSNMAEIVAFGVEDMVLFNWGNVRKWIVYGPMLCDGFDNSAVVNFGYVSQFKNIS